MVLEHARESGDEIVGIASGYKILQRRDLDLGVPVAANWVPRYVNRLPVIRMPFLMIQNSSTFDHCPTSQAFISGARGYIHKPTSMGRRPSIPLQKEQLAP